MFICMIFLPMMISEKKQREGHTRISMFHVPEMYYKEWYREDLLWVRSVIIYSQVTFLICLILLYIFKS